jgi:predicted ABC-type ATPase
VDLYYLWLSNVDMSIQRVAERVKHGGHDIPREDIIRRYPRSLVNLLEHYAPLCSSTTCIDNSGREADVIFVEDAHGRLVENQKLYNALLLGASYD